MKLLPLCLLFGAALLAVSCRHPQSVPAPVTPAPVAPATRAPTAARAALPVAPASTSPAPAPVAARPVVWRVEMEYAGDEERLAAVCLQGLANRTQARVYLDYGQALRWMQIEYDRDNGDKGGRLWSEADVARLRPQYRAVGDYWLSYYQQQGLFQVQTVTLAQLVQQLTPELKGVILYNSVADDLALVATMAGVRAAVPLTEAMYLNLVAPQNTALPVLFDARSLYAQQAPGTDRRLAAHRWMLEHIYPDCSKTGAVSRDRTYGLAAHDTLVDIDLAVSQRWVTFDLSFMSSESRDGGEHDRADPQWGFDPPDKELLIKLLAGLEPWSPVYGWGRPYESALVRRLALARCVKVCAGTGNGSFLRHLPRLCERFTQPPSATPLPPLEQRYYVAFMTNEGDTLKSVASLVNGGQWLQSERGQLPINWGVDPLLVRDTPGLMSYYYRTATSNDYFFSAPSGWGYLAPMRLADADIAPYGELVRQGGILADTHFIDVWWMAELRKRNQFFPLLSAMGMQGLTQWSGRQEVEFAPDGTPVIHSNLYYVRQRPEDFAAKLVAETREVPAPWFIVVYGGGPHWFAEVARRLPPEQFKVVKLDEFFHAARAARSQLEGRSWPPPKAVTPSP